MPRFVIQEHYARSHHFDLRLEREGVLISWAVPKGMPTDTKKNRLAMRVDDHDMSHLDLEDVTVSITHERRMAMAVAVAHRREGG